MFNLKVLSAEYPVNANFTTRNKAIFYLMAAWGSIASCAIEPIQNGSNKASFQYGKEKIDVILCVKSMESQEPGSIRLELGE